MRHAARRLLVLLAACMLPLVASAEPLNDGLQRCARETDEHLRLKCFDELAASVPQLKRDQFGAKRSVGPQGPPDRP